MLLLLAPRRRFLSSGRVSAAGRALKQLVSEHRPLCVAVTDAADFEGTCPPRALGQVLSGLPVILAINGADRAVRLDSHDVRYLQRRFKQRGPKLSGGGAGGRDGQVTQAVSVSSTTGEGVDGLVDAIMRLRDGRDVVICGLSGAGSSPLAQSLAAAISADTRVGGGGSGASGGAAADPRRLVGLDAKSALWDAAALDNPQHVGKQLPPPLRSLLSAPQQQKVASSGPLFVGAGESVVLEMAAESASSSGLAPNLSAALPGWRGEDDVSGAGIVLGRVDVVGCDAAAVEVRGYLSHPLVSLRVVPTAEAPGECVLTRLTKKRRLADGPKGNKRMVPELAMQTALRPMGMEVSQPPSPTSTRIRAAHHSPPAAHHSPHAAHHPPPAAHHPPPAAHRPPPAPHHPPPSALIAHRPL